MILTVSQRGQRHVDPAPLIEAAEAIARRHRARTASDHPGAEESRLSWELHSRRVSDARLAALLGVTRRAIQRWRHGGGIRSIYEADRLACRLGLHPTEVWGPAWFGLDPEFPNPPREAA